MNNNFELDDLKHQTKYCVTALLSTISQNSPYYQEVSVALEIRLLYIS